MPECYLVPAAGTTTNLSVLGSDDGGEANLTYAWTVTAKPAGAANPTFNVNGSNAAKNTTATFNQAGSYTFRATITDAGGLSASSDVTVSVNQTLMSITVSPATATVPNGGTQQFSATGKDQFGNAMASQPSLIWSIDSGGIGTVSGSGLYTAPSSGSGAATVRAGSATVEVSGTASVTVQAVSNVIRVNFQDTTSAGYSGYLADTGAAFGDRGNGYTYGWNIDNSSTARNRDAYNSADERYDTLQHMQKPENPNAYWEIAVPNGTYTVRVVAGDPIWTNSIYRIDVEGTLAIDGTPTDAQRWFENTVTVTVTDGKLTVSNAAGAVNNKINYIEITRLS